MTTQIVRPARDGADPPIPAPHTVTRRSVLKAIGIGGATVLVAGTGIISYRVFDNGVLDSGSGGPYDPWTRWRTDPGPLGAVGAAILAANPHNTQPWLFHLTANKVDVFADPARVMPAANPHNTQPWLFHLTANKVDVFADPARVMPAVDPFNREHDVGLGCALENLALGLSARGFAPTVVLLPQPADPTHVATVTYTAATPTRSPLYDAIGDRHSNRGPYRAGGIAQPVLDDLPGSAGDYPGTAVRWFTSAADKAALTAVIMTATRAFIADQGQSKEAFSWFRNNRDDIDKYRDGPTLDAQGLAPLTLALAKILPASTRTAGDQFWLEQTRTVHTATAAAYGIITVADTDDVAVRLSAGRLLQHIHLAATAKGLGLQHMNQVTERIDRERSQGLPATMARQLQGVLAQPGRQPLVTFRVGHPVRAALRSPRRPVSAVTR